MCNILYLRPGQMPIYEEFITMCHNNWHSYGMVTLVDGRLDIKKNVPESGEIDGDALYKLVAADKDFPRLVHVRHATAGLIDEANCHPFEAYYNQKTGKHVVFAHNGTLYQYKSKKMEGNTWVDDDSGKSDTVNFLEEIIIPTVSLHKGDISQVFLRKIIRNFWPATGNRGVLMSNDDIFMFGDWKKTKAIDGTDIASANEEYFDRVIRGPEYERREEKLKLEEASRKKSQSASSSEAPGVTKLSDIAMGSDPGFYELSQSPCELLNDWEFYDREAAAGTLGFFTKDELEEIAKHPKECVDVMNWVFTDYTQMYDDLLEIEEKHEKATKMIASLMASKKKDEAA